MVKLEINTETLSTTEARALALFFLEVRNIDRDTLDVAAPDASDRDVDAGATRPVDSAGGEGRKGADAASGAAGAEGQNAPKTTRRVSKEAPVFVLENKKTGVSVQCDSGRKGEVEATKGHIEAWIRDAASVEEVAGLAAEVESFAATCLSKKEQQALAKLVMEVKQSFAPDVQKAAAEAAKAVEQPKSDGRYTLDSVKAAGRALASAKGLPAVETILAKFDYKSFKDVKETDFAAIVVALDEALK